MGIHRNLIHPKFGNFVLLGTVATEALVSDTQQPIDYNPCLECKLCVAACPVGAIGADGAFNFSACYTHNYREFMGGFTDWVEQIGGELERQRLSPTGWRRRVGFHVAEPVLRRQLQGGLLHVGVPGPART